VFASSLRRSVQWSPGCPSPAQSQVQRTYWQEVEAPRFPSNERITPPVAEGDGGAAIGALTSILENINAARARVGEADPWLQRATRRLESFNPEAIHSR
jgi:hypothetical protein